MKNLPQNCHEFIEELTEELKLATPEMASYIIYRVGYLFIFAGYGNAAHEVLSYLQSGTLQMNPSGPLNSYQYLILTLCNALGISSPDLPEHDAMSADRLSQFIEDRSEECRAMMLMDKYSYTGLNIPPEIQDLMPIEMKQLVAPLAPNWTDKDLQIMTGDTSHQPTLPEIGNFLKEVQRVCQFYCRNMQFDRAIELIELYDRVCGTWKLSRLDYISKSMTVMAINIFFIVEYNDRAEDKIMERWQQIRDFSSMNDLLVYPPIVRSLLSGVLRDEISISFQQVDNFIRAVNNYSYTPQPQPLIIPSTSDWKELMEQWNDDIFTKSNDEKLESYQDWYPQEFIQKNCSKSPATDVEIEVLEKRLGKKVTA